MEPKFKVGDLVRTIPGSPFDIEGIVTALITPDERVITLWGTAEQHYQIRDTLTNEYLNVVERTIEGYTLTKRRRRKFANKWQ